MLRIFSPILRDDHVTWMRLKTAESIRDRVFRLLLSLILICLLHSVCMYYFEDLSISDSLWLTLTSVTTVGYGDLSASTPLGRMSTIFMLYVIGISLLAQVASEFVEYRIERRTRMLIGRWRWKTLKNHILIINVPDRDTDRYLTRLVQQIRSTPGLQHKDIHLLTQHYPDGLPESLTELGVVHRTASPEIPQELMACNIEQASFVLVLAEDASDARSDAQTLNILLQMKDIGVEGKCLVEAVLDENRARFKRFGATSVLRPVRAYPEILVRAMISPGAEVVLEDLFTYGGVFPQRIDVAIEGVWGVIASKLMLANLGVPLGYITRTGQVLSSPDVTHHVETLAILMMVTPEHKVDKELVLRALGPLGLVDAMH